VRVDLDEKMTWEESIMNSEKNRTRYAAGAQEFDAAAHLAGDETLCVKAQHSGGRRGAALHSARPCKAQGGPNGYDYVIIGAGSCGLCPCAPPVGRPGTRTCSVLEAGPADEKPRSSISPPPPFPNLFQSR